MTKEHTPKLKSDSITGVIYAGSAFLIWGLGPISWKALGAVPSLEIIVHRVVWAFIMIWTALIIYSTDSVMYFRRKSA